MENNAGKQSVHEEHWNANFEALKAHVALTGHFPNKHTKLNNWVRYQRKRIKAGLMPPQHKELFMALCAQRSNAHTGGRRKKTVAVPLESSATSKPSALSEPLDTTSKPSAPVQGKCVQKTFWDV